MKRLFLFVALLCLSSQLSAQPMVAKQVIEGMSIYDVAMDHEDDTFYVEMSL